MYVDDIIGVGFAKYIEADLVKTRHICTDLLGSTAVADEKTEVGVRMDVIDYRPDDREGTHRDKEFSDRPPRFHNDRHYQASQFADVSTTRIVEHAIR